MRGTTSNPSGRESVIIISGHIRVKPEAMDTLRPHIRTVVETSRKENGCILYAFGEDVLEPGLIRVVERWESWDPVMIHVKAEHAAAWDRALEDAGGVLDREILAHEVTGKAREV